MQIAIFHNLEPGGALVELSKITKILISYGHNIDLYSLNHNLQATVQNKLVYIPSKPTNLLGHLKQAVFELNSLQKKQANIIDQGQYDLVLVFPCIVTQSPHILRHLKHKLVLYFFAEPKREFYENVSFEYHKVSRLISRTIRRIIQIIDLINCKTAKYIIANSQYSLHYLKKVYKQKGYVIYPGKKDSRPHLVRIKTHPKQQVLSVGLHSKIKGHDFSIRQIYNIAKLNILGTQTNESKHLFQISSHNSMNIRYIYTKNNSKKISLYQKHNVFLANQTNEPFGLTTLEACTYNNLVLGKNLGGTPEIVRHGLNGFLYPPDLKLARKILKSTIYHQSIQLVKTSTISWKTTVDHILSLYHQLKHEPTE